MDWERGDVWLLGIAAVSRLLNKDLLDITNKELQVIDEEKLSAYMNKLRTKISYELFNLISKML